MGLVIHSMPLLEGAITARQQFGATGATRNALR